MKNSVRNPERGRSGKGRLGGTGCCAAVAILAWGTARAEDDRAVDDVPPGVAQMRAEQQGNRIDLGANFDVNVFERMNGIGVNGGRRQPRADGQSEAATLAVLRKAGDARLARIDADCRLSETQRRKLRLAIESDIRRAAEDIDLERRKYAGVEVNLGDQAGQRQWADFQQDVQRCRERIQGLGTADSLLMKVLPVTLDAEQQSRLAAETAARRTSRWKGLVTAALLKFDDQMGLDQRQHEELEKVLLEKQPPLRLEGFASQPNQHAQQMIVFLVLSEIEGQRLRAFLSERQSALLTQLANQGKAMRSFVEAQGILEKVSE